MKNLLTYGYLNLKNIFMPNVGVDNDNLAACHTILSIQCWMQPAV